MKDNHFCSVIMSVYNGEEFLSDAIESILQQTYKNFEFIIINDASTDNSLEIIQSYNDNRIVIINNDKNSNPKIFLLLIKHVFVNVSNFNRF